MERNCISRSGIANVFPTRPAITVGAARVAAAA
jgi:hypothetical protein